MKKISPKKVDGGHLFVTVNGKACGHEAVGSTIWKNIAPNGVSVRDGFNRSDYEEFRSDERRPQTPKEYILACRDAYKHVGIVRNVIDLQAEYASKGIRLEHPVSSVEKIYNEWFLKVGGPERSERFLNAFYRDATVIVKRITAKLRQQDLDKLRQGFASSPDVFAPEPSIAQPKKVLPWGYVILNPISLEIVGEELAPFIPTGLAYAIKIPDKIAKIISNPKNTAERELVKSIPPDIVAAAKSKDRLLFLDPSKIISMFYKKEDWEVWGNPMLGSILDDLTMLQKLKLADIAALDGAISQLRVWMLGNSDKGIYPTQATIDMFADLILYNVGGGSKDIVWGPDLELKETSTEVHKFLGDAKYVPTWTAIHSGLGIPPTLSGSSNTGAYNNSAVGIKTLVERLAYGRQALNQLWTPEIKMVQQALGFSQPATLAYDQISMIDEASEKKLYIDLWDRELIPDEVIQKRYGENPQVLKAKIKKDYKQRKNNKLPPKVGPFSRIDDALEKIFATTGWYTPEEFGLTLEDREPGSVPPAKQAAKAAPKPAFGGGVPAARKKKGVSGQGRPGGSTDRMKRKQKSVKTRMGASQAWALEAQQKISDILTPIYLGMVGKDNLRKLNQQECDELEDLKFGVLANCSIYEDVTKEVVEKKIAKDLAVDPFICELAKKAEMKYVEKTGKKPTLEHVRRIQAFAVAITKADLDEEDGD